MFEVLRYFIQYISIFNCDKMIRKKKPICYHAYLYCAGEQSKIAEHSPDQLSREIYCHVTSTKHFIIFHPFLWHSHFPGNHWETIGWLVGWKPLGNPRCSLAARLHLMQKSTRKIPKPQGTVGR